MTKPERIQRRRTKGWKMPPNTVYVGRRSKWGNPYIAGVNAADQLEAVGAYKVWLNTSIAGRKLKDEKISELRGKNLACWCALDKLCHADVLLEIANTPYE